MNDTTLAASKPHPTHPVRRILLTRQDSRIAVWLEPMLRVSGVEVVRVDSGIELERALHGSGPFDLVVATAALAGPSGLQVLAKARTHGIHTPFIIVMSFHGELVRVMVSDVRSATLSSRMLDATNFVSLAQSFVRPSGSSGVPADS